MTGEFWRRCAHRRAKWRGRHGAESCCDKLQRTDPPGVSCCLVRPASGRPPWPDNSPTQRSGPGTDVVYESDLRVEESATCQPCTRRRLGRQRHATRSRSTSSHSPVTAVAVFGATTLRNHLINQIRWELASTTPRTPDPTTADPTPRRPGQHEPFTRTTPLWSQLGGIGTGLDPRSSRRLIEVSLPGRRCLPAWYSRHLRP